MSSSKKVFYTSIVFNKQTFNLVKILYNLGAINSYLIYRDKKLHTRIRFSVTYFKNEPFFKNIKLVLKPSKYVTINLKGMHLIKQLSGLSTILLSTSYGIITMDEALKKRVGGKILCILN